MTIESWGRYPKTQQEVLDIRWRSDPLPRPSNPNSTLLPHAWGRSYGDSCLNDGGAVLLTRALNRFISFDPIAGILRCEAGVTYEEILRLVVPQGWFVPVTPGTQYVSVGGAVANDVHGKNHHQAGTFGCHVTAFELLRSDGTRLVCTLEQNKEWFSATIGGLGLTGLILWVEFKLRPIHNPFIQQEVIKFKNLDSFFEIAHESDQNYEYTVAWIDCLARGANLGRGLFMRGNHGPALSKKETPRLPSLSKKSIPIEAPGFLLNDWSIKLFNFAYYGKQLKERSQGLIHYAPFFYPLDSVQHWNRMYGKRGFLQYQCVVPPAESPQAMRAILEILSRARLGSFLSVLKKFGDHPSPGILSFPRAGATLALDFPNQGKRTLEILDRLDEVVRNAGGSVYPAKDSRMNGESFQAYFPQWSALEKFRDPKFSSSFWRRVARK